MNVRQSILYVTMRPSPPAYMWIWTHFLTVDECETISSLYVIMQPSPPAYMWIWTHFLTVDECETISSLYVSMEPSISKYLDEYEIISYFGMIKTHQLDSRWMYDHL